MSYFLRRFLAETKKALENLAEEMIPGRSTLPYKKAAIKALGEDTLAVLAMRAGGGLL